MFYEIVCIDKYDSFINCIVSHIKLQIQQNTVTANMLIHVMNLARSNFFPQYQKNYLKMIGYNKIHLQELLESSLIFAVSMFYCNISTSLALVSFSSSTFNKESNIW